MSSRWCDVKSWRGTACSSVILIIEIAVMRKEPVFGYSGFFHLLLNLLSVNRPVSDSVDVDCASNNASSGVANTSTVDPAPVVEDFNQEIAAKLDIKEDITRVCRLQTACNNVPYSTEEEYYRRAVYVPYFDYFYNSLKERFESHKETVASLQHILPEFCTKTDFYSLEAALNFYEEDLSHKEVVQSEFMLWKEKWSQEKSENLPKTAISSLEKCDKTFFPNIYIILKLLAVLPASVATVERSFSSLRRLKTYLKNTTSESRLNGLALLSIHRDIKIRDEEVLDKFASVPRNLDFVL
ncbi:repressor of the inhibitor of the protein kinase [Araneus ventricosus]|uniref:Repressor of the inhibitor of the protein kinase n=1 Tax=Araneus ventricosus TaxID=182803 RepID=A0A4Y2KHV8_ARAVE|nr:repressor of the inhibitor of the protein kinase [Araneus ventricosus]